MAKKNRMLFGLASFGILLCVLLMLALMGKYERGKRTEKYREQIDKFAELEEQLPDMETLRRIPIAFKERVQPLDSVARSKIRQLSGRRTLFGQDCVRLFLSMVLDDESYGWADVPCLFVEQGRNEEWLGDGRLTTVNHLESSAKAQERLGEVVADAMGKSASLHPRDSELLRLRGQAREIKNRMRHLLALVPPTADQRASDTKEQNDWHLVADATAVGHDREKAREVATAWSELGQSWRNRDMDAVNTAAAKLTAATTALAPELFPSEEDVEAELSFNRANPFNTASWIYLVAAFLALFGLSFSKPWLRWAGVAAAVVGLALQGYGFYLRTTLGFGVTITNLYESMVAVAAATVLLCVLVDVFRGTSWALLGGGLGAFAVLRIVDNFSVKFDDTIGGTIAVLANNVWVHIHVPVVMSAYASFFIAFILGTVGLAWVLIADRRAQTDGLRSLLRTGDVAVNLGTILMLTGTVLGGVWAYYSWGRFWGWDPKENAALCLFLYYMVIVHGRFTKWLNPFWSSWTMFLGGLGLLWAYYGTNEFATGLHSYANSAGDGGFWENVAHAKNRWFVITSASMLGLAALSIVAYYATGGAPKGPVPGEIEADESPEPRDAPVEPEREHEPTTA